jgi:uncharacterized membrane protein YbhN (UPF0104 family)
VQAPADHAVVSKPRLAVVTMDDGTTPDERPPRSRGSRVRGARRRIWRTRQRTIFLVLCAVAAYDVGIWVSGMAGHRRVLDTLFAVNPIWFAPALGAQCLAYVAYAFALQGTARVNGGPRLGFRHSMRVVAAGFGAWFARSSKGGFELDYRALRGAGARRQEAMSRVLGLGMLEYAVLAPAALGAAMWLYASPHGNRYAALTLPWLAVIPGFAAAFWLTGEGRRYAALADAVGGLAILRSLVLKPHRHIRPLLGTSAYWFCEMVCLWSCLRAFHAEVGIPALVLAYATGYVVSRRGLPLGGIGVAEAFLTFSLFWLGVPLPKALLGVFAYRLFNFWLALLPAALVAATVREIRESGTTGAHEKIAA